MLLVEFHSQQVTSKKIINVSETKRSIYKFFGNYI